MVSELDYSTYCEVHDCWERIRRVNGYQEKVGIQVFMKFFSTCPEAMVVFGYKGTGILECVESASFLPHARRFVSMFDKAIDMLGPDIDMLTDIMIELGRKHAGIGVKKEFYPPMGVALISALRDVDPKFTSQTEICWKEVYSALTIDMGLGADT
eukprot:jgi/Psemu1/301420/fgenesh1_kg.33_\